MTQIDRTTTGGNVLNYATSHSVWKTQTNCYSNHPDITPAQYVILHLLPDHTECYCPTNLVILTSGSIDNNITINPRHHDIRIAHPRDQ